MQAFWTTAELNALGEDDRAIAAASRDGVLVPVRRGCWAHAGTDPELVRAARVGGVATAHSAARHRGLWVPPDPADAFRRRIEGAPGTLRVAVPRSTSSSRLRSPDDAHRPLTEAHDVQVLWRDPAEVRLSRRAGVVSVLGMLRDLFRLEPPERALAVVESALRQRHLRVADLPALAAMLPERLRGVVLAADTRAESGAETVARYLLRIAGLRVEPQVAIAGVGRVDLLVEGRLIVEIDGRRWHDGDDAFAEDRRRDLVAASHRYRTLRFTWYQVLFCWDEVQAAVFAALAA